MYTSSSLSPLPLSLSKVPVLDLSPLLPAKQLSFNSIPFGNVYFGTSSENRCRRHACGGGDGGDGGGSFAASEEKGLHIGSNSQEMSPGDDCQDFLKNNLNKADLIRRLSEFVKREVPCLHLDYSLVITLEKQAWETSLAGVQNLSPCNHEEADTHFMYHCLLKDKPTVVIALDTDILILMVNVFASCLPDRDWFFTNQEKPVCECI